MRYFFHLEDGACIRDPKGVDFPDDAAALARLRPSLKNSRSIEYTPYAWRVVVKNAKGFRVGSVPLVPSEAVSIPRGSVH